MIRVLLAILAALAVHGLIILFGGALFLKPDNDKGTLQEVELLTKEDEAKKDEPKPEEPEAQTDEELATEDEPPPVPPDMKANLEPALEAMSLSAIEAALSGAPGGGGDFAEATNFNSGGRIGGLGAPGGADDALERAFSLAEIDQKPQLVFQTQPLYPGSLRARKLEGVVSVIFIVDSSGRVTNPRVEKSTHPAFEKPALEAVRKWKFEPAVRGGQRVACKMRVPIRFTPS